MRNAHVAITVESPNVVDAAELARVTAAIQRQVLHDFAPAWGVHATVDAFPRLDDVPARYWPVVLTRRRLDDDEGFHLTRDGEPFAVVEAATGWSLTASHEILEMLADPTGARVIAGPSPAPAGAEVDYLVEVCDPCQSARDAYAIDGVIVSDFVLPAYFEAKATERRFSFTGAIASAHGLARGGALTYFDRSTRRFVHLRRDEVTDALVAEEHLLDEAERRPARALVHATVERRRRSDVPRLGGAEHTLKSRGPRRARNEAARSRADALRAELASLGGARSIGLVRADDDEVGRRIAAALAHREALPPAVVALLEQAARELAVVRRSGGRPVAEEQFALSMARSLAPARAALLTARDVPGLGAYEHYDVRWAKALVEYALHPKALFPVCPASNDLPESTHRIADDAVIALAGDWGTHNEASARIGGLIERARPTHTVHLGDVYYAGTDDEERRFVHDWPAGSAGSFALNSNHEMYSGGHGYFDVALRSKKFGAQTCSYFALHTATWIFVGIDSAYHATKAGVVPYQIGRLHAGDPEADPQVAWLRRVMRHAVARRANGEPKRLCVFSHHHALEPDGAETALFADVRAALDGRVPDVWYWGHVHGAAAYEVPYGEVTFRGRLAAHGGVPYLSEFDPARDAAAHVVWAERPRGEEVGTNGFVVLRLVDGALAETFYDEHGAVQYTTTTRC